MVSNIVLIALVSLFPRKLIESRQLAPAGFPAARQQASRGGGGGSGAVAGPASRAATSASGHSGGSYRPAPPTPPRQDGEALLVLGRLGATPCGGAGRLVGVPVAPVRILVFAWGSLPLRLRRPGVCSAAPLPSRPPPGPRVTAVVVAGCFH